MSSQFLYWSNHSDEFIFAAIGVLEKSVEGSETNMLIETNITEYLLDHTMCGRAKF